MTALRQSAVVFRIDEGIEVGAIENQTVHIQLAGRYQTLSEREILTALDESGVLTVSDMPGFTRRGGMIQFVLEGERVRFEINLASAESARLVLSSELLKVAASVKRNGRLGD
jgi:hypothetical protein